MHYLTLADYKCAVVRLREAAKHTINTERKFEIEKAIEHAKRKIEQIESRVLLGERQ